MTFDCHRSATLVRADETCRDARRGLRRDRGAIVGVTGAHSYGMSVPPQVEHARHPGIMGDPVPRGGRTICIRFKDVRACICCTPEECKLSKAEYSGGRYPPSWPGRRARCRARPLVTERKGFPAGRNLNPSRGINGGVSGPSMEGGINAHDILTQEHCPGNMQTITNRQGVRGHASFSCTGTGHDHKRAIRSRKPAMTIPAGKRAYSAGCPPVHAEGLSYSGADLDSSLRHRLPPILRDDSGRQHIGDLLGAVATTAFASQRLKEALSTTPAVKDWQVGEALAEAFLVDHRECEFPWPAGRDLRNPNASPAGADLVGFQAHGKSSRFAFGEVKTSAEQKWPPQVVSGRHGLAKQLEDLRDSTPIKDHLAIVYLGHRASKTPWAGRYRQAASRYLANDADISLFGFLVRDVAPKPEDLHTRAIALAKGCPKETSIEMRALYLPPKSIPTLAAKAKAHMGGAK